MKRAGKCAGKKSYSHKSTAIRVAMKAYKYRQLDFGVYECPTCLDFHLTSKYCNLQHLHREWLKKLNTEIEITFNTLIKNHNRMIEKQRKKVRQAKREKRPPREFVPKPPNPNCLPLAKQREILANFQPKIYPQSNWKRPWWTALSDIIKGRPLN